MWSINNRRLRTETEEHEKCRWRKRSPWRTWKTSGERGMRRTRSMRCHGTQGNCGPQRLIQQRVVWTAEECPSDEKLRKWAASVAYFEKLGQEEEKEWRRCEIKGMFFFLFLRVVSDIYCCTPNHSKGYDLKQGFIISQDSINWCSSSSAGLSFGHPWAIFNGWVMCLG